MTKLQSVLLMILADIDKLLKQHNIKYFLDAGTALGAIRHKGFIPWDDDIDIVLLPEDKDKFNYVCHNFLDKEKYKFEEAHKDWPFHMSKIKLNRTKIEEKDAYPEDNQGIYIDVFYFDYARKSNFGKFWQFICGKIFVGLMLSYKPYTTNSMTKKATILVSKIFRWEPLKTWLYNQVRGQKISNELSAVWDRKRGSWKDYFVPISYFDSMLYVDFEGERFPVCKEYHKYLSKLYGDYMQLPPENERVGLHTISVDYGNY